MKSAGFLSSCCWLRPLHFSHKTTRPLTRNRTRYSLAPTASTNPLLILRNLQFNVSVRTKRPQAAYQHASKDVEQVRQVLHSNGLDPKTATVGFFSVQPVYE